MECETCGESILDGDVRYLKEIPLERGGTGIVRFCSVECINREEEFTEEEIESLLRSAGYGDPPEPEYKWEAVVNSGISNRHGTHTSEGEYFIQFQHTERTYDIEIFHQATEQLWEVVLWTYDEDEDGEKLGIDQHSKRHTGVFQRALFHAEDYMDSVEAGEVVECG